MSSLTKNNHYNHLTIDNSFVKNLFLDYEPGTLLYLDSNKKVNVLESPNDSNQYILTIQNNNLSWILNSSTRVISGNVFNSYLENLEGKVIDLKTNEVIYRFFSKEGGKYNIYLDNVPELFEIKFSAGGNFNNSNISTNIEFSSIGNNENFINNHQTINTNILTTLLTQEIKNELFVRSRNQDTIENIISKNKSNIISEKKTYFSRKMNILIDNIEKDYLNQNSSDIDLMILSNKITQIINILYEKYNIVSISSINKIIDSLNSKEFNLNDSDYIKSILLELNLVPESDKNNLSLFISNINNQITNLDINHNFNELFLNLKNQITNICSVNFSNDIKINNILDDNIVMNENIDQDENNEQDENSEQNDNGEQDENSDQNENSDQDENSDQNENMLNYEDIFKIDINYDNDYLFIGTDNVPEYTSKFRNNILDNWSFEEIPSHNNNNKINKLNYGWKDSENNIIGDLINIPLKPIQASTKIINQDWSETYWGKGDEGWSEITSGYKNDIDLPLGKIGITTNGIFIYSRYSNSENDDTIIGINSEINDSLGGHPDMQNIYHYRRFPLFDYGEDMDDHKIISILNEDLKKNNISGHSKIIGYAFDGYPIYGPIGFDPYDDSDINNKKIKLMQSKYKPDSKNNFKYHPYNEGDLDICNGIFGPTPEHPNGIYHYHTTIEGFFNGNYWQVKKHIPKNKFISASENADKNESIILPQYPYIIGKFKGIPYLENFYNQVINEKTDSLLIKNSNLLKSNPIDIIFKNNRYFIIYKECVEMIYLNNSKIIINLNIDNFENMGLMGMAFHSNFNINRKVYLYYREESKNNLALYRYILSEFKLDPDYNLINNYKKNVYFIDIFKDINLDKILFFNDFIYLSVGDGGLDKDDIQQPDNVYGKILRFNPDYKLISSSIIINIELIENNFIIENDHNEKNKDIILETNREYILNLTNFNNNQIIIDLIDESVDIEFNNTQIKIYFKKESLLLFKLKNSNIFFNIKSLMPNGINLTPTNRLIEFIYDGKTKILFNNKEIESNLQLTKGETFIIKSNKDIIITDDINSNISLINNNELKIEIDMPNILYIKIEDQVDMIYLKFPIIIPDDNLNIYCNSSNINHKQEIFAWGFNNITSFFIDSKYNIFVNDNNINYYNQIILINPNDQLFYPNYGWNKLCYDKIIDKDNQIQVEKPIYVFENFDIKNGFYLDSGKFIDKYIFLSNNQLYYLQKEIHGFTDSEIVWRKGKINIEELNMWNINNIHYKNNSEIMISVYNDYETKILILS